MGFFGKLFDNTFDSFYFSDREYERKRRAERAREKRKCEREVSEKIGMAKADTSRFRIWKTIGIGTKFILKQDLEELGVHVHASILDHIYYECIPQELDLVLATGLDFGLGRDCYVSTGEFLALAEANGLERCPAEVGPQLRMQYLSQNDEWDHLIAMTPRSIPEDRSCCAMFIVGYYTCCGEKQLFLNQHWIEQGDVWRAATQMVFVRPRV